MSQDFFMDETTEDWFLENGTTIRLCESTEELTRQRVAITLRTFQGEWFADTEFGIPYFQTIFGKNTKEATDSVYRSTIRGIDGVINIIDFTSSVDTATRVYSAVFSILSESGVIENIEV